MGYGPLIKYGLIALVIGGIAYFAVLKALLAGIGKSVDGAHNAAIRAEGLAHSAPPWPPSGIPKDWDEIRKSEDY